MNKVLLWITLFLSFLSQNNAYAFCEPKHVQVRVEIDPGKVHYITTKSSEEFPPSNGVHPIGLTMPALRAILSPEFKFEELNGRTCVRLNSVELKLWHDGGIKVYIDKNYKPGSCGYNVIREHEDYHVAVFQQALHFFKPDLQKKLREIADTVQPQIAGSTQGVQNIVNSQVRQLDSALKKLFPEIKKAMEEKNAVIDTPESYKKTYKILQNRCKVQ